MKPKLRLGLLDRWSDATVNAVAAARGVGEATSGPASPPFGSNHACREDAASSPRRGLHEIQARLPVAQREVEVARAAVHAATQRHDQAKQSGIQTLVAAKSATTRALLLEIAAKRAMDEAVAVAKKARSRVVAARQAAKEARGEAETVREQVKHSRKSEATAAVDVVCAEERLEKAEARLQTLIHKLVLTRDRRLTAQSPCNGTHRQDWASAIQVPAATSAGRISFPQTAGADVVSRQQVMADLLEIEAALNARTQVLVPSATDGFGAWVDPGPIPIPERRQHQRLIFPTERRPLFSTESGSSPILDLSANGVRLESGNCVFTSRVVRAMIAFADQRPIQVTGKVVRKDDHGLSLRLVTRIDRQTLDRERLRLSGCPAAFSIHGKHP
jgi:hypothetical protein